jgi:hypothetical protein
LTRHTESNSAADDDVRTTLRAIAAEVHGIDATQIHFGHDYEESEEGWARDLRDAGASFDWLAYSFGTLPMWIVHAGVVIQAGEAHVGLHVHNDAPPDLRSLVEELGPHIGPFSYSEPAREWQYNEVSTLCGSDDLSRIGHALGVIYADARAVLDNHNSI